MSMYVTNQIYVMCVQQQTNRAVSYNSKQQGGAVSS